VRVTLTPQPPLPQAGTPFDSLCLPRVLPGSKGYRCFDLISRRVLISRHVVFDESVFPFSTTTTPTTTPDLDLFSLFSTDTVVQPPLSWSPAGTALPSSLPRSCPRSPTASAAPGPAPCPGPGASSSGAAPAPSLDEGPGASPSGAALAPTLDEGPGASASGASPAPPLDQRPLVLRGSSSRCACTSAVRGRLHCLSHHRRSLLRRGHRHHHRSPRLPVSCRLCTTHRSTDTRGMFTL
jgi:hypothetical protein